MDNMKIDGNLMSRKSSWKRRLYSSAMMVMLCALIMPTTIASVAEASDIAVTVSSKTIVVDKNGSGQFRSVQAAIDSVPTGGKTHYILQIKKGQYYEKILIPASKPNISLIGESVNNTILTYNDSNKTAGGTTKSASTTIRANDFHAENITFSNTAGRDAGQAVALYVASDRVLRSVTFAC